MAEAKKPTPTQRIKELEAEIKRLEQSILKLTDYTAQYGNEQFSLGLEQGRLESEATYKAQSYITRLLKR